MSSCCPGMFSGNVLHPFSHFNIFVCVCLEELTPPLELLQMIASWIQDDPRLVLITFLNTPLSGNQPISSLDVTPLGGLVRWCVKAPLAYRRDKKQALTNGSTESEPEVGPLFSALHLSVLQVCGVFRYIYLQYTFICSVQNTSNAHSEDNEAVSPMPLSTSCHI